MRMVNRIQPLGLSSATVASRQRVSASSSFADLLQGLMEQAVQRQSDADELSRQLALGETDQVHAVMIAAEKAALTWQLLQQVRNKLLEAWQEIMRMQI